MQQDTGASRPSRLNKWWPIGVFIGAVVCFIIGGALMGAWVSSSYNDCSYSSYYSSYYSDYSCVTTNMGESYGAVAMFVIGGVLKLTAWILLIIFCVKRKRYSHHTVTYVNSPPVQQPKPFQQPYASSQPTNATPQPVSPEIAGPFLAGTPHPKEANATATASKYCGQCGTAVFSRVCPQCGARAELPLEQP